MKYSLRNFLVVFFMSIVIFAVAAVFLMQYIQNSILSSPISDESAEPIISTEEGAQVPQENKNTLSYLVLGLDEDGAAAYLLLTHIDRGAGTFLLSDIPADLRIELGGEYRTLGEAALLRDIEFVREKVYALTAVRPDYLFTVEAEGFVDLIDRFGTFEFEVPCAMQQSDPERGLYIDLAAGKQAINGSRALQILQFDGYASEVALSRSTTFRALVKAMCHGILTAENNLMRASEMLPELYADLTTDMTLSEANSYLDTLFSFAGYDLTEFTYPGKCEGEYYLPDTASALEAYKPYR